jgi:hypothetical protein
MRLVKKIKKALFQISKDNKLLDNRLRTRWHVNKKREQSKRACRGNNAIHD